LLENCFYDLCKKEFNFFIHAAHKLEFMSFSVSAIVVVVVLFFIFFCFIYCVKFFLNLFFLILSLNSYSSFQTLSCVSVSIKSCRRRINFFSSVVVFPFFPFQSYNVFYKSNNNNNKLNSFVIVSSYLVLVSKCFFGLYLVELLFISFLIFFLLLVCLLYLTLVGLLFSSFCLIN